MLIFSLKNFLFEITNYVFKSKQNVLSSFSFYDFHFVIHTLANRLLITSLKQHFQKQMPMCIQALVCSVWGQITVYVRYC